MRTGFIYGVLLLLSACSLSGDDEVVISTVQPGLRLDLANPFVSPDNFALRFTTTEEECASSKLLADGLVDNGKVHVEISGLLVPSVCGSERVPIGKDIPTGLTPGSYQLSVLVSETLLSHGFLNYDGDTYNLSMDELHGLEVGYASLRRIPENIVWGEIRSDVNVQEIFSDFKTVSAAFTSPLDLPDGYYGHFSVEGSSAVNLHAEVNENSNYSYPFVYRLKSSPEVYQEILDVFRTQHADKITIVCTTWEGTEL